MKSGIYKITNIVNGKIYIGSSVNLKERKSKHFWMLNKGIHDNKYLQMSFTKYGKENFIFEVIEYCDVCDLISRENFFILEHKSNDLSFGYNLALVNDSRRNIYNDEVKLQLSKYNQLKNKNFSSFSLTNIENGEIIIFDNLFEAGNYLVDNGFTKSNPKYVRMKLSLCLRGKKFNNGTNNKGSIRKTFLKHEFNIIN
jgi:hypothetical protein